MEKSKLHFAVELTSIIANLVFLLFAFFCGLFLLQEFFYWFFEGKAWDAMTLEQLLLKLGYNPLPTGPSTPFENVISFFLKWPVLVVLPLLTIPPWLLLSFWSFSLGYEYDRQLQERIDKHEHGLFGGQSRD